MKNNKKDILNIRHKVIENDINQSNVSKSIYVSKKTIIKTFLGTT